jgi:hypothetical protein
VTVGRRINSVVRSALLRLRVHRLAGEHAADPNSAEYLYLVQQSRRLSLSKSIARLRPRNLLILPLLLPVIVVKTVDLWIANQIIRSLINERDLIRQSLRPDRPDC